jgi:hypothetical protein
VLLAAGPPGRVSVGLQTCAARRRSAGGCGRSAVSGERPGSRWRGCGTGCTTVCTCCTGSGTCQPICGRCQPSPTAMNSPGRWTRRALLHLPRVTGDRARTDGLVTLYRLADAAAAPGDPPRGGGGPPGPVRLNPGPPAAAAPICVADGRSGREPGPVRAQAEIARDLPVPAAELAARPCQPSPGPRGSVAADAIRRNSAVASSWDRSSGQALTSSRAQRAHWSTAQVTAAPTP